MDRKSPFETMHGRRLGSHIQSESSAQTAQYTLEAYTGIWNFETAAHLLRRSMFGPTRNEIEEAVAMGMEATLDQLFQSSPMPEPPLNYRFEDDPQVAIGESWVDAIYTRGEFMNMIRGYRERSLMAWNMGNLIRSEVSIREKMTLFWHNHFVVQSSIVRDPKFLYQYIQLLRENATGNFKNLVKKITIDPAMLRYLNGNQNTRVNPNENYARELLELFTIGKGDLAGPGDYTTFTEDDVIAVARILTGWRDFGFLTANTENPVAVRFIPPRHDTGNKQLSHRFNNKIIENGGEQEYEQLIDIIFEQEEVARFLSRKLYRWFVYYEIDDQVEQNIIEPMAQLLMDNNFETAPVIRALLGSQHFFDANLIGPMIKHPLDFVVGTFRQLEIKIDELFRVEYNTWLNIARFMPNLQMSYFEPPDVAGWKAFYQEPGFYQIWISSATLGPRMQLTNELATQGIRISGRNLSVDVLALAAQIENSTEPDILIEGLAKLLFPQPLSGNQVKALKEVLIPGLPDFEWTVEYGDYLAHPEDDDLRTGAENRLKALIQAMLVMPEYYLS